jgi:UDP-GlcNAc:undecaprenyl-phosphate GlcNAc-1-phosphate transferase
LVSVLALAGLSLMNGRMDAAALLLLMGGAILGFLKYNYNPARIFLGDAGSMLIGFFLATAATDAVGRKAVIGVLLLPIAVAGVPLLDVLLAIWRRGVRRAIGRLKGDKVIGGIFDADAEHLHHRLLGSGRSQRKVAGVLQGIAILLALLAFLPMFLGDRLLGISVVGFMIIGLVGLRNLARVEIEHTGSMIHLAIKLPGHKRRAAVAMFLYDLLVFMVAGLAAVMIETNLLVRGGDPVDLGKFVIVFAVFGNVALLMVRVHRRLWVRATMRDFFSLAFWMSVAAIASFTVYSLSFRELEWCALRLTFMSYIFAYVGISLPRAALDILREIGLNASHRSPKTGQDDCGPVVVLGAGDLGTLFLDHLKSSAHDVYPGMRILGFIDQTKVLHGRQLRSFPIHGGLSDVPRLVKESHLQGIVVAISHPPAELLAELDELSQRHQLKIYQWSVGLDRVVFKADDADQIVDFGLKAANL